MPLRIFLIFLAVPLFAQDKFAYNPLQIDTSIVILEKTLELSLPEKYRVKPQTLNIYHNQRFLEAEIAYRFSADENKIFFFQPLTERDSIRLIFQIKPFNLRRKLSISTN